MKEEKKEDLRSTSDLYLNAELRTRDQFKL